jgi:hypothetical protein
LYDKQLTYQVIHNNQYASLSMLQVLYSLLEGNGVYKHWNLPLLDHPASVDVGKLQTAKRKVGLHSSGLRRL